MKLKVLQHRNITSFEEFSVTNKLFVHTIVWIDSKVFNFRTKWTGLSLEKLFSLKVLKIFFNVTICTFTISRMLAQHQFHFIVALWFRHLYFHGFHSLAIFFTLRFILFFPCYPSFYQLTAHHWIYFSFFPFFTSAHCYYKLNFKILFMNWTSNIYHKYKNPISSKKIIYWEWVATLSQNVHSIVCALDVFFGYICGKGGIWKWKWRLEKSIFHRCIGKWNDLLV